NTQVSGWVQRACSSRPCGSMPPPMLTAMIVQWPSTTTVIAAARRKSTSRLRESGVASSILRAWARNERGIRDFLVDRYRGLRWLDASSGSVLDLAADDGECDMGVPDRLGVGEEGLFGSVAEQSVRPVRGLGVQSFGDAGVGVDDDEVGVHAGGQVASAALEPGGERGSLRVQTDGFDGGQAALGLEARGRVPGDVGPGHRRIDRGEGIRGF